MFITRFSLAAAILAISSVLVACGDEESEEDFSSRVGGGATPRGRDRATGEGPAVPSNLPPLPEREFADTDFIEAENNRDPFRNYEHLFEEDGPDLARVQRSVLASQYSISDLNLVGIVGRGGGSVLLQDPAGLGWIAKRGDFLAKAESVSVGGTSRVEVLVNWRVDRITDNDVTFIREDPAHPELRAATHRMTLRSAEELEVRFTSGQNGQ